MAKKEIDFIIKVNNKEVDLSKTSLEKFDAIVKTAQKDLKSIEQQFGKNSQQYKVAAKDIQNAEAAWKKMTKATQENEEQTKINTEGIKTYSQQIRIATRELVAIEQQFGKNSEQYAAQAQKVKNLRDAQEELSRGTLKLDDALSNIPGPIGQIGQGMQQLEVVSQSAKSAFNSLGLGFKSLDQAIKTSGVGALVLLIVTLVAAVVEAAKKSEPLQKAFAVLGDAVGALFDALKPVTDFLINVFVVAVEVVASTINGLASLFGGVNKGLKQQSLELEKQLAFQESILSLYNSALTQNLEERLKIENDFAKKQREITDATYKNELVKNKDLLLNKLDYLNKTKDLNLKVIQERHKLQNELDNIDVTAVIKSIDNQREQTKLARAWEESQNAVELNMLRNQNNLKIKELKNNATDISKSNISNKNEVLQINQDALNELNALEIYYRDKEKSNKFKFKKEEQSLQRQYNREDTAAINERANKILELTTSLIKEENARNLQAAKDKLKSLKEEHRLELEEARLQGVSLKNLKNKQAAQDKVAKEDIRKAQLQLDAYNFQLIINEENRNFREELSNSKLFYQRKRDNILVEYQKDFALADGNRDLIEEARTKEWEALLEIDREELGNIRSNLEMEYDGMYQVSAEAFSKLRDIENAKFEEQRRGNEQNFEYIEALTKQHAKNLNMIDVQELETMASLLERKADTEKKLYGQMFRDLREAEDIAYAARVKAAGDNVELLEIIEREHVQKIKDLQNQKIQAYAGVATAMLDSFANVTNALAAFYEFESQNTKKSMAERKAAFEQNKKYQIATAALSAASGIIQILTQPSTLPSPFDWIVKIANAAALGIMTAVQISKIKATEFNDGGGAGAGASSGTYNGLGRNYGDGGMIEGPSHQSAAGGVMINAEGGEAVMSKGSVSMFGPMLSLMNQMGGGASFIPGLAGSARPDNPRISTPSAANSTIIKTYVVSSDMTSEQHKQSRLKDLSTL
jgi:hypothetical protein